MAREPRKIYRVTELTRLIKDTLEGEFRDVWLEGELSNVRRPSSGHYYFTIKDETAQISAVLFRGNQRSLRFTPKDGLLIQVFGQVSVYERSGNYQILVRQMEESGKGSLQAAFEALKEKLRAEGLFAADRKRPLPLLPQHIGIVTSPTGAAIRDMLKIFSQRSQNVHVVLAPVRVQGEGAAADIADAIRLLNDIGGFDVLIVGRGGGSLEDLWCFNEESVARAIAASSVPIISAVGHEIDFTISDFVADARAPTPSAAAEELVIRRESVARRLVESLGALAMYARESLLRARNRLTRAGGSYVFAEPRNIARRHRQQIQELRIRASHSCAGRLREAQQRLDDAGLRLSHDMDRATTARREAVARLSAQLRALNPAGVLARGYSITKDADGRVIMKAAALKKGQRVFTRLSSGEFESSVV